MTTSAGKIDMEQLRAAARTVLAYTPESKKRQPERRVRHRPRQSGRSDGKTDCSKIVVD